MSPKNPFNSIACTIHGSIVVFLSWVRAAPLKGPCKCARRGYAGSPYRHMGVPVIGELENLCSSCKRPDEASMLLSCCLPSTGPYKWLTSPLGNATDWNFMECTRLCPLYRTLWLTPGLHTGRTVPSMKPQQLSKAAPDWCTASAYNIRLAGESRLWL